MQVLLTSEHRFDRTPDGFIWTSGANAFDFWSRYLDAFDRVEVLARVRDVDTPQATWIRADGDRVSFKPVPYYLGPRQYLQVRDSVRRAARAAAEDCEAVIMRTPSLISDLVTAALNRRGHPYGLEVVGDPYDVFAPSAAKHPLRAFFRFWFAHRLRAQCKSAMGVAYVTARVLQRRYPCKAMMTGVSDVCLPGSSFATSYSSIELKRLQILDERRARAPEAGCPKVVFVGSLAQLYKAPDILIKAVAKINKGGTPVHLTLLGDGRFKPMLESLADGLGLKDRCEFLGHLSANRVLEVLDHSDLFVLPSHTEGLPRAMIEAMARGVPCIGSAVGGIPELLKPDYLVRPGDVTGLQHLITKVISDPLLQCQMSVENLNEAEKYAEDKLRVKRTAFYSHIRQATEAFIGGGQTEASRLPAPLETSV